jgi:hypothetical protein
MDHQFNPPALKRLLESVKQTRQKTATFHES